MLIDNISFKISVLEGMRKKKPKEYQELNEEVKVDYPWQFISNVSISSLIERSGELDQPETHVQLAKMIHSMVDHDFEPKEWLSDGGSPLTATKLKSSKLPKIQPILGYRYSVAQAVSFDNLSLPAEQWRVGASPAMMASSVVRGFGDGSLRVWNFKKCNIPAYVMEAFSDPSVEPEMYDFLKSLTIGNYKSGKAFENAHWFHNLIYAFIYFDLPVMVEAVTRSPAFQSDLKNPQTLVNSILCDELFQDEPKFGRVVAFFDQYMSQGQHQSLLDKVMADRLLSGDNRGLNELEQYLNERLGELRQSGRIELAAPWLSHVMPTMGDQLALTDAERGTLRAAIVNGKSTNFRFVSGLCGDGSDAIPLLVNLLGTKGFTQAVSKACVTSLEEDLRKNGFRAAYTGAVHDNLLQLDVETLKLSGGLHAALDGFYNAYPTVWGQSMQRLEKAQERNESDVLAVDQVKALALWVGQALTAEPCSKRATQWYSRLKYDFAQEILVMQLSPDKGLLQKLNSDLLQKKFTSDLGL